VNVLIVGSGAREHAIAWKLQGSARLDRLFIAPGNAGTALLGTNLPIEATDLLELSRAISNEHVDFVIVGPEAPLALGLVDLCAEHDVTAFGPTQGAARIESSKAYAKEVMARASVPTGRARVFVDAAAARDYVTEQPYPLVVKADGLAAGKGVLVCRSREEAVVALEDLMVRRIFGEAGDRVLVEECLEGPEVSLLCFVDGDTILPMPPACDYKRVGDGDTGPNTGGMGAYSPPDFFGQKEVGEMVRRVVRPTLRVLAEDGHAFRGVLYAGLMVTKDGPKVIEFNARFGDPEAQVVLPRLESDLLEVLWATARGRLHEVELRWRPEPCVGVVLASGGYPARYDIGLPIRGLETLDPDVVCFHAGTRLVEGSPDPLTDGGRVLTLAALGGSITAARERVYRNIPRVRFPGAFYRHDIAAGL